MRAVVQRVSTARVTVGDRTVGEIGSGALVLLGISKEDGDREVAWFADKLVNLRIWPDDDNKMNHSLLDVGGDALLVSQFTLYGDASKGRRPSFIRAAQGPDAEKIYEACLAAVAETGVHCAAGEFGAMMQVSLVNDGPVTILLDSERGS
ncbi:MAG: D-aminoacyl-tRNA deacylase [Actinomycetota bacterium]|nr:D-aminoacyl-tRNA deacylase [Actinomycetota bacterium]